MEEFKMANSGGSDLSNSILFNGLKEANSKVRNLGFVYLVLGILCCFLSPIIGPMVSMVVGISLGIAGFFHFFSSFGISGFFGKIFGILFSFLLIGIGIFMVFHPVLGTITLVQVSMLYYFLGGILEIIGAFQWKPRDGWWSLLFIGILSLVFASILWNNADAALWLIGLFLGINLSFKGLGLLSLTYSN